MGRVREVTQDRRKSRDTCEGEARMRHTFRLENPIVGETSKVQVWTSGPGSPKVLNPDLSWGPVLPRWMNPNPNIGSSSCANPVQKVREPDHGQSSCGHS